MSLRPIIHYSYCRFRILFPLIKNILTRRLFQTTAHSSRSSDSAAILCAKLILPRPHLACQKSDQMTLSRAPRLPMRSPNPIRRLLPILILNLTGFAIAIPVLPALAYALGGSALDVGLLYAVQSLGQFIMAPGWGRLSDRFGR